jgi:cation diffusion facilitator CzcD-associated flavoprotein CzcO
LRTDAYDAVTTGRMTASLGAPRRACNRKSAFRIDGLMSSSTDTGVDFEIGVVGAGFGGVLAALELRRAGRSSFAVFERSSHAGGVWRENDYPGCACDVQSPLYCLASRPNPDWATNYAGQPEILAYLERVIRQEGLKGHIRFNSDIREAQFDAAGGFWCLTDQGGQVTRVRVLILAIGSHSRPFTPNFPGMEQFGGALFHSAAWDSSISLAQKRVAVIGAGASAIQIVPNVAPMAGRLSVFQRTPAWVVARGNRAVAEWKRQLFRRAPIAQWLVRLRLYWMLEAAGLAVLGNRMFASVLTGMATRNISRSIRDADLRRLLTPNYRIGCKRILVSDDYYPAFTRDNVELITEPIAGFTASGLLTASGREIELDVAILATGFRVADPPGLPRVVGSRRQALAEQWMETGMQGHLGVHVSGFPNLAILMGPNSGPPSASAIHVMETQMRYILRYIDEIERQPTGSAVDVRPDRQRAYNEWLQQELKGTAWNSGCRSWYLDRTGRNTTMYPGLTSTYRRRMARLDPADYRVISTAAGGGAAK